VGVGQQTNFSEVLDSLAGPDTKPTISHSTRMHKDKSNIEKDFDEIAMTYSQE